MNLESNSDIDHHDSMNKKRAEIKHLKDALNRIAFCGAGEDYRVLRDIAAAALQTK